MRIGDSSRGALLTLITDAEFLRGYRQGSFGMPSLRRCPFANWPRISVGNWAPPPKERKGQRKGPPTFWHQGNVVGPQLPCEKHDHRVRGQVRDRPDDPFVLFKLGAIAVERQGWPTALGHLQRSLRGSAPTDSIVRKLFALVARCHQMLGNLSAALNACSEGLRIDPDDPELHFRKAVLHRKAGQLAEAEACWRRILTLKRPDQFCSVDQGIYGRLTPRNLAVLAEERGDRAEARRLWRMVLNACPGDPEAMSRGELSR